MISFLLFWKWFYKNFINLEITDSLFHYHKIFAVTQKILFLILPSVALSFTYSHILKGIGIKFLSVLFDLLTLPLNTDVHFRQKLGIGQHSSFVRFSECPAPPKNLNKMLGWRLSRGYQVNLWNEVLRLSKLIIAVLFNLTESFFFWKISFEWNFK